jgi:hypothetical protein
VAHPARGWLLVVAGALAIAALTLPWARMPTFDPLTWAIWGREMAHGQLVTAGDGSSFKPLPVFVDAVVAVLHGPVLVVWLLITRAAAVVALALTFRLAQRLGGLPAGLVAVTALVLSTGFTWFSGAGMAEQLETATVLAAVLSWVTGRREAAVAWLTLTSLLRPEAWPLLAAAGLATAGWSARRLAGRVVLGLFVLAAWFAPEYAGSGDIWRSAQRAGVPTNGGPQLTAVPGWSVIRSISDLTVTPLVVVAIGAAVLIWYRAARRRPAPGLLVASVALAWLLVLAVMAQLDLSTGVLRYLAPCGALLCALAGYGCVVLARLARRGAAWQRAVAVAALVCVAVPSVGSSVNAGRDLGHDVAGVRNAQHNADVLRGVVRRAGGRDAIVGCGPVTTGPFEHPVVSWTLGVHLTDVSIFGIKRGTALEMPIDPVFGPKAADRLPRALPVTTRIQRAPWLLGSSCALGG